MTHQLTATETFGSKASLYTYVLGSSGTATVGDIVVSGSGIRDVGAKSYHNVDHTTPVDNTTSTNAFGSSTSLSVTSENNDLVCDCLSASGGVGPHTFTANVSQTQTFQNNGGSSNSTISSSQKAGAASVSMDWTLSSELPYVHLGMNINSASLLPVELMDFRVTGIEGQVALHWETASERINKGFEIERSADGEQWENIGFVAGNGTTTAVQRYEYIDQEQLLGTSYYRLKQVDFDGGFEYSKVVSIESYLETEVTIFPNPVKDKLHIIDGEGQAIIYNILGQPLRAFVISEPQFIIPTQDLLKGQYVLQITQDDGSVLTKQFMK